MSIFQDREIGFNFLLCPFSQFSEKALVNVGDVLTINRNQCVEFLFERPFNYLTSWTWYVNSLGGSHIKDFSISHISSRSLKAYAGHDPSWDPYIDQGLTNILTNFNNLNNLIV